MLTGRQASRAAALIVDAIALTTCQAAKAAGTSTRRAARAARRRSAPNELTVHHAARPAAAKARAIGANSQIVRERPTQRSISPRPVARLRATHQAERRRVIKARPTGA